MQQLIILTLALLAVASAGAAPLPPRPLHHKSVGGMPAAYLATPAEIARRAELSAANSGVFQPYAVLGLGTPGNASAGAGALAAVGTDSSLVRLGWSQALTVTQSLPALSSPAFLAAADLNGDRLPDLAAVQRPANQLALAAGGAGGSIAAPAQRAVTSASEALLADDLNADCRADLAFTGLDGTLHVLPQQPDGTLGADKRALFANGGATDLATGDFNHDGQLDLAALRGTGNTTRHIELYTITAGTLGATGARSAVDGDFAAHAVASGDVTGDGRADLVVSAGGNMPNAYLNIFVQQPDRTLAVTPTTLTAAHIPEAVAVGDVNHDGYNDVVALHSGWLSLSLYPGRADGTLAPYEQYSLPYSATYRPETLSITDLNRDGGLDVLIADGDRGVTYLVNEAAAPTATISTPAACTRVLGRTLALSGTVSGGTAVELSLDGGATWEAASVDGTSWSFTIDSAGRSIYPRIMARARAGLRVQAPPATIYMQVLNHQHFLPAVTR